MRRPAWLSIRRLLILTEKDEACPLEDFHHVPFHGGQQILDENGELRCLKAPEQIHLFFDIFFVAALTMFGFDHNIEAKIDFHNYVAFFTVVWFTWLQIALYDLRFGFDSVLERFFMAAYCAVMVGFVVVSPDHKLPKEHNDRVDEPEATQPFRILLYILMFSRLMLCIQYGKTIVHLRGSEFVTILWAHIVILFTSAMVFFGLTFNFSKRLVRPSVDAYCIVISLEVGFILALSCYQSGLSLRNTCIMERMGVLTLIVLGEGALRFCHAVQGIDHQGQQKDNTSIIVSGEIILGIVQGVAIIYCAWTFYFDQQHNSKRTGSFRHPLWIVLHYFYHLAALITLEGVSRLVHKGDPFFAHYLLYPAGTLLLVHGCMFFAGNLRRLRGDVVDVIIKGACGIVLVCFAVASDLGAWSIHKKEDGIGPGRRTDEELALNYLFLSYVGLMVVHHVLGLLMWRRLKQIE